MVDDQPIKRRVVQSQTQFRRQINCGQAKFYELMRADAHFPKRFKIGGKWVYYIDDCNEYVRQCELNSPPSNSGLLKRVTPFPSQSTIEMY